MDCYWKRKSSSYQDEVIATLREAPIPWDMLKSCYSKNQQSKTYHKVGNLLRDKNIN